jgi:hypothetical protein
MTADDLCVVTLRRTLDQRIISSVKRHKLKSVVHRHALGWRTLRALALSLVLVLANSLTAWAITQPQLAGAPRASAQHHCHEASPRSSAATEHNAASCPCCGHGCFCLYAGAAPLPRFFVVRHLTPAVTLPLFDGIIPSNPLLAEHLRPPIA